MTKPKILLFTIVGTAFFAVFSALRVYVASVSDKEEPAKIMPLQKPLDLTLYSVVNPTIYVKTPGVEDAKNTTSVPKKTNVVKYPALIPVPTDKPKSEPPLIVSEKTSYYDISGSTENELRNQMNTNGVTSEGYPGQVFDAKTVWNIRWNYPRKVDDGVCTSSGVTIYFESEMILPRWINSESGSEELRNKWNNFIKNLIIHEDIHRKNSSDGAHETLTKLNTISGFNTCLELDNKFDEEANKILETIRTKDKTFDQETNHGMSQGVIFP